MPLSATPVKLAVERYEPDEPTEATPLVIAHGLFGSGRNWASLARRFAKDPSKPRPVITVDMRNHGGSPWSGDMTYPAMAEDLRAAIETHTDGHALILGHSMGGKAAMATALKSPGVVSGLLVADMAPVRYRDHGHEPIVAAMRALPLSAIRRRSDADPLMADAIPEPSLRAFVLQNLVFSEGVPRWRINLSVLADSLPRLMDWPDALAERRFAGPALFYHGGASDFVAEDGRAEIARQFPHAAVDAMPDAGHWLHAERPDAFFERASQWLSRRD